MSEPLKRVGRGGAGNYVPPKDASIAEQKARENDLEAQRPASSNNAGASGNAASEPAPYVRTGRGGAGNYSTAEEAEMADALELSAAESAAKAGVGAPGQAANKNAASGGAPLTRGRGGAGNYAGAAADEESRRKEEEQKERARREKERREAENQVDGVLRPPGKAVVHEAKYE